MLQQTAQDTMNTEIEPLCPRDNITMHYDAKGIQQDVDGHKEASASFYCGSYGCNVRYTPAKGYFTVVDTPHVPSYVDEPGTNLFRCPNHGTWLFRLHHKNDGLAWRCGIDGCDYERKLDDGGYWLRE